VDTELGRPLVSHNQDGRLEVFATAHGAIFSIPQITPNGGWAERWHSKDVPQANVTQLTHVVGRNADGRQEIFALGDNGVMLQKWQVTPNGGWSDWASLGKPRDKSFPEPKECDIGQPVVQRNADGHLEVFAPGDGAFCNRWQESPGSSVWRRQGWNAKPPPAEGVGIVWLDAARNFTDHLEVFALADDGALWHAWQVDQPPFWSDWASLDCPPPGIREADRLTIGANQDGRLEVFVVGEDGVVWHIWQIR
jgi:hypothetical protein